MSPVTQVVVCVAVIAMLVVATVVALELLTRKRRQDEREFHNLKL